MLMVRRNNYSNWLDNFFDDSLSGTELMPHLRREFSYGNYEQSYTLPDDVDRDKISAGVANGILTITIPKTTPEQEAKVMRNIEVK